MGVTCRYLGNSYSLRGMRNAHFINQTPKVLEGAKLFIHMKKILSLLMILLATIPLQAQFIAQMNVMTPHYYPGIVYFTDGHNEEFAEVELPRTTKSKLAVKRNADDKKRTDIDASDIFAIRIWHKDFPDKVHDLYYVRAKKSMMQSESQWGNPVAGSNWGILFKCEMNYQMDKKTGDLTFVKFVGGNAPDTPTLYYLKRPEKEEADLVIWDTKFAGSKKKIAELFKENEEIYNGIKSGKLKATDIQYILDEMAGGKPAETMVSIPTETPVEVHEAMPTEMVTDTIQNGVVGDDE